MRYSFTLASLSLISSALAITVTSPSSGTTWDFSTPKTIKFTSDANDPSVISIILRTQDGSFQTKLADNVQTSSGEYTTQPNPSISNGSDYEIEIIDSSGELAVSQVFTVEKGASDDTTTSSSSSTTSTSSSSSSSSSTISTSSLSFSTSSETTSTPTPTSATPTPSVSSTPASSTSPSSSPSGSTTSSSSSSSTLTTTASTASGTSSSSSTGNSTTTTVQLATGAGSSYSTPKGAMALMGAALALLNA